VYTERGKKLSDLIRWGEDTARVTLVFDNKLQNEERLVPKFDADSFRLSRYLNRDGNYWYETNFETVNKSEVTEILRKFGINPDNMLIIMHQHMMVEFGIITPQKKLLMVEEAVGLREYRYNVLEAQQKLTQVLSEEESVSTLLKNAEQTLDYWKSEYERYQRRKELLLKRDFFERELAWAQLIRQEQAVEVWKDRIRKKEGLLDQKENEIKENENVLQEFQEKLNSVRQERNKLYNELLAFEREKTGVEEAVSKLLNAIEDETLIEKASPEHETTMVDEGFESNQMFEKRLNELQTRVQLLKQEADKLENERDLFNKLMKDKEEKEKTVHRERERLDKLSGITDQISLTLEALSEGKKQIALEEARRESFEKELGRLVKRLPSVISVKSMNDSVELAQEVSRRLQSEVDSRKTVKERRMDIDSVVETLTGEEHSAVTATRVCETEIDKFNKHHGEVNRYLDGSREKPQIRCDKCGSLLASDQWVRHLKEIAEQRNEAETKLNILNDELQEIQQKISEKRKEQQQLHREEQMLETIRPMSMQALQLYEDLKKTDETLNNHIADQKRIITDLAAEININETHRELDSLIERRAMEIQAEARTLKLDIPRLEATISNFDDLHVKPQRERVENAQRASENYQTMLPETIQSFKRYIASIESQLQSASQKKLELEEKVSTAQTELDAIEEKSTSISESYQDARARKVLLEFQMKTAKNEVDKLTNELNRASRELEQIQPQVESMGARVDTDRNPVDVSADIKVTNAHLALLKDVSADVEKMYLNYLNLYNELKEKVNVVSENRERALKEVDERKNVWRNLLQSLLDDVNPIFKAFLEKIGATGWVSVINTEDFEEAGLELTVGFRGAEPHVLDSQTQSGGERSSTTMAFLLALQRHIKSPFRAVDEFDVHMDPRNREIISQMLLMEMEKEMESQYLVITPGQLTSVKDDSRAANKCEGRSTRNHSAESSGHLGDQSSIRTTSSNIKQTENLHRRSYR
jgi:chromosome segregation ATPase